LGVGLLRSNTAQNPKKRLFFQNLASCANCAIGAEMAQMSKKAPGQLTEAVAAGGSCGEWMCQYWLCQRDKRVNCGHLKKWTSCLFAP
jgi:hypothetical protein